MCGIITQQLAFIGGNIKSKMAALACSMKTAQLHVFHAAPGHSKSKTLSHYIFSIVAHFLFPGGETWRLEVSSKINISLEFNEGTHETLTMSIETHCNT